MRRLGLLALVILAPVAVLLSSGRNTSLAAPNFTPTAFLYFPGVYRQPSLTPTHTPTHTPTVTATPTPTATPTSTSTPTPTATLPPGTGGLNGQLAMVENKPSYATYIEWIKFHELIWNPTSGTVYFGILGVETTGPIVVPFKTSWDGAGAPNGVLEIYAGCYGPAGIPCAPNADAGRHEDHVGEPPHQITEPGTYQLKMFVCYSNFTTCQQPGGIWQQLGSPVSFVAVHWTPSAPVQAPPTLTPVPTGRCYLITDDLRGIYLSCPENRMKSRYVHARR